ncbi:putative membrane protein YphA (DoxX/SURF4 family) [Microbacterium sp. ZKA21]|uniref:MauE/DoxX family redox-associated membrane protein n=1 Tax=Microbacterium sp. ZKA21 TaxID=3381694 RepID=UPI003D25F979
MIPTAVSALLGGMLLLAGIPKLRDRRGMLQAVQGYRLLPAPLERLAAAVLPLAEVLLGAFLVAGVPAPVVPACAAALFLMFFAALALNLLRGRRELDCGCFAFRSESHTPRISWFHAIRALLLAATAAGLALVPGGYGIAVTPLPEQALGLALAALVFTAVLGALAVHAVINPGRRSLDSHLAYAQHELRSPSR